MYLRVFQRYRRRRRANVRSVLRLLRRRRRLRRHLQLNKRRAYIGIDLLKGSTAEIT